MSDLLRGVPRDRMIPMRPRDGYVLIAMPNAARAAAFKAAAAPTGHEVVVIRDGDEVRQEIVRRGVPVLFIVDLSLPRVDGFELLRELRQLAPRTESSVIVVSGHAAIRTAARRLSDSLGISKILPFDIDRAALRDAVEGALDELATSRTKPAAGPAAVEARTDALPGVEESIDNAVMAAARKFHATATVAYVKVGSQEHVRGYFAVTDPSTIVNTSHSLSFLRQIALATDPLIVPNVASYPAITDIAPAGLPLVRGFAAVPVGAQGTELVGTLCIMEGRRLELDASDLDALEAIGRDLTRDLGGHDRTAASQAATGAPTVADIDNLERLASADPLTGLANRRGGEKDIAAEISRARRQNTPLSCVLLDIDHFKDVNDTFGHQAGDYVLRELSALLRRTVRAYDILVRWGGEEFLVVLPGVEQQQALKLAERIRQAIENLPLAGIGGVTASVGVASLGSDYSFDAMFAAADRRLYTAKSSGRNTVA